jgi:molybdopterin-guanine dinucleotide biosynthesis protein A
VIARASIDDFGVLVLAGGEATRLPGKLTLEIGDVTEHVPMIARVFANVAQDRAREIAISGKATFARDLDAHLTAPLVIDRWARRGPLGGMLSSFARMRARFVFVVAGDAPMLDIAFAERLARAYEPGDEALVPSHLARATQETASAIEPLAALYDRLAFLREGVPILRRGRGALHLVIAALRTRYVPIDDARIFTNVNTPADFAAYCQTVQNPTIVPTTPYPGVTNR